MRSLATIVIGTFIAGATGNSLANDSPAEDSLLDQANLLLAQRRFGEMGAIVEDLDTDDAALVLGATLNARKEAAAGLIVLLRAADSSPSNTRLKASIAFALSNLGLTQEAKQIWPFPDADHVFRDRDDYEVELALAKSDFENNPAGSDALFRLAWAHFNAGEHEDGLELARQFLDDVAVEVRPSHRMNMMFVYDAWHRGDIQKMRQRLAPLEAHLDHQFALGLDSTILRWRRAIVLYLHGLTDEAYAQAEIAYAYETEPPYRLNDHYKHFGWNQIPRFVALREEYSEYLKRERLALLAVACGDEGFETWRPLPANCAEQLEEVN